MLTQAVAADADDLNALVNNRLSKMIKGKILFLYHPDQYMPIFSQNHLEQFISKLNISVGSSSSVALQKALMEYRYSWPELKKHSAVLFMSFLYQIFPEVKSGSPSESRPKLPLFDTAIQGAEFIQHMPPSATESAPKTLKAGKPNYDRHRKRLKRLGDLGEAIVLQMERERLIADGRADLADNVEHASEKNDRLGYDILSYDKDGTPRHVEVKATSARNLDRGFYITNNELEQADLLPNYYIYLVFSVNSKKPKILPIKRPQFSGNDYVLHPLAYHVTVPSGSE